MNKKLLTRLIYFVINIAILLSGCVISAVLSDFSAMPPLKSETWAVFTAIAFFIVLLIGYVELISIYKISDSTVHTFLMAVFMLICLTSSPDARVLLSKPLSPSFMLVLNTVNTFSFIAMMLSYVFFFRYTYFSQDKKSTLVPICVLSSIIGLTYIPLSFFSLEWIAHLLFLAVLFYYIISYSIRLIKENKDDATFFFSSTGMFSMIAMQSTNVLFYSKIISYVQGWSTFFVLLNILCFIAIYISFSIRTDQAARRSVEYKLNAERLKNKVLVQQIKPHFIFNSLMKIKSMYHKSLDDGDKILNIYSDYLRECIGMIEEDLVPFSTEIENIAQYIDFINISQTDKFNVIYDIEETDFSVPPFSLQPFVENSIKYSQVNKKPDGYIMFSTHNEGNDNVLKIIDNGVGFDIEKITDGMFGIKNASERFKLILGITPLIKSQSNFGTEIVLRFKRQKREGK